MYFKCSSHHPQTDKQVVSLSPQSHLFSPHGVVALLLQCSLQVKVLWVVGCLSTWVTNVALGIQALCDLHGVLRTHACNVKHLRLIITFLNKNI